MIQIYIHQSVREVEVPVRTKANPIVVLGLLVAAGIAFLVVVVAINKGKPQPNESQQHHAKRNVDNEPTHVPKIGKEPSERPKPVKKSTSNDHDPSDRSPTKTNTTSANVEPIWVAPPPRVVDYSVPLPEAAFTTEWIRIENIETRVIGVMVGIIPLRNRAGNDFFSTDRAMRIWIETRAVAGSGVSLRRWASTLEPAKLFGASGTQIGKSSVTSGSEVRGELFGTRKLLPGEEPIRDVLVFDLPPPNAGVLLLTLEAEHIGLTGKFRHYIPATAWKK